MKRGFKKGIWILMMMVMITTNAAFGADVKERGDMAAFFRNLHVPKDTDVHGSVVAIFGNADIEGRVMQDVVTIFGNANIDGNVAGNVVSVFGGINISSSGSIQGDAVQVLGGKIVEAPGAFIGGEQISIVSFGLPGFSGFPLLLMILFIFTVIKSIIGYGASVITVLIFPERFHNMCRVLWEDMGRKFLIGILVIIGFYVVSAMLVMVVIGIPFVLLLAPVMFLLGFTGNTAAKLALGKKIGDALGKNWSQMMELFIGTLVYGLVDLTIIGKSAAFLAKAIGVGTVIDSKFGRSKA